MIPSSLTHTLIIVSFGLLSFKNVKTLRLMLIYGFLWQFSNYLSLKDVHEIVKTAIAATFVSLFLSITVNLPSSRFVLMFALLQIIALISYLILLILHPMTENQTDGPILEIFSLVNTQLIWLDLMALAGISYELGRDTRLYSDDSLYYSISSFWHSSSKKALQKVEAKEKE